MALRVVFMGSPDYAVPPLLALAKKYAVVGVVTQPDRPAGRGQTLTAPPIKNIAASLSLTVFQPERLRKPEAFAVLQSWEPDLIVVAAYGQILRQNVLDLPRYGCINIHASLLPRWRGAAPIQAAILAGDAQTGITIMKMDAGIDTGAILSQSAIPILPGDTGGTLTSRLAQVGADLLMKTLPAYLHGEIEPQIQDANLVTHAPLLKKEDGELDFTQPAENLARKVRAYNPAPGTYAVVNGQPLKIIQAHADLTDWAEPGKPTVIQRQPAIGAANGCLVLDILQPAGKKPMQGGDFLRGARDWLKEG